MIAMRSMHDHVADVAGPLQDHDLPAARQAVAMIVGRDASVLDEAGVARAALESLAENTSDGIVAPVFWGVIFGLPGLIGYKAINTLDLMIGHRTPKYEAFGWASARIDDLANFIPARLTGLIFALVSTKPKDGTDSHVGRRAQASVAQCGLARGGAGGRFGRSPVGSPRLCRRDD